MSKLNGKWINKDTDHLTHDGDNLKINFKDSDAPDSNKVFSSAKVNTISGTLQAAIDAASSVDEVEYITVDGTDVSNKYTTLTHTPYAVTETALDIIGGCAQIYGTDYTVSGTQLGWNGLGLDGVIEADDNIRVSYTYA